MHEELLENLTAGEKLLILRRRKDLKQHEAALEFNVPASTYGKWERNQVKNIPEVEIGDLSANERCLLYRKRSNTKQEQIATKLKCSRYWVNKMERGLANCDELLWYWEQ